MQECVIGRVLMTDGGHKRYELWKPCAANGFTQEYTWEDAVNVKTDTDTDGDEPSVTVGSQFTRGQKVLYTKTSSQVTIAQVQSDLLGGWFYDIILPDGSQRQTVADFLRAPPVRPPKPPGGYSPPRKRELRHLLLQVSDSMGQSTDVGKCQPGMETLGIASQHLTGGIQMLGNGLSEMPTSSTF